MNRKRRGERLIRRRADRLSRWLVRLGLALLLLAVGRPAAAESGPDARLGWRSPAVEAEASIPWLPADPELAARLRRQAFAELAEFVADAETELADLVAEDLASAGFPRLWDSRVEIVFTAPCCLSLRRDLGFYSGGAHGNSLVESIFWDRRTKRVVRLDELLDLEAAKPVLDRALADALRRERARRGLLPEPDTVFGPPTASPESVFTLAAGFRPATARGILFHFPPYALGPYVEGGYALFVPAARFLDHLRPGYRALFATDRPPVPGR